MAISSTHYALLKQLRDLGVLPQRANILEIGKANWYGDFAAAEIASDHEAWYLKKSPGADYVQERWRVHRILTGESQAWAMAPAHQPNFGAKTGPDLFAAADIIYQIAFDPSDVVSIDLDPSAVGAIRADLNDAEASAVDGPFMVCINHGTAEHIFDIANVFRLMHDATEPGGLMIHESPFTGWVDHGFYCLQPTLFWDLAAANEYELLLMAIEHLASRTFFEVHSREQILEAKRRDQLPDNAMLFVVFRKLGEPPFKTPMQGVYGGTVSDAARHHWLELR